MLFLVSCGGSGGDTPSATTWPSRHANNKQPVTAQTKQYVETMEKDSNLQKQVFRLQTADLTGASGIASLPAGVTGESLKMFISPLIGKLEELVRTASGEARTVLDGALGQLRSLESALDHTLEKNVKVPIEDLSVEAQSIAMQIFSFASQVDLLVTRQRECAAQDVNVLLSGVRAAIANTTDKVPLIKKGDPWLGSYKFEKLRTPNLVPREGGRFTISGYNLWTIESKPPLVKLINPDNEASVANLPVSHGPDGNSISINLPDSILKKHIGECLHLQVTAYTKGFLWSHSVVREMAMCIPQRYNRTFQVRGFIAYQSSRLDQHNLERKGFTEGVNSACGQVAWYESSLTWPVPDGYRIISIQPSPEHRCDEGLDVTVVVTDRTTVTARGHIASPNCTCAPFVGCRLNYHAYWRGTVVPTIEGYANEANADSVTTTDVRFDGNTATTTLTIPKTKDSHQTIFWFTIKETTPNMLQSFDYQSPRLTATAAGYTGPVGKAGNQMVNAYFNPTPINGNVQMQIKLEDTGDCGY